MSLSFPIKTQRCQLLRPSINDYEGLKEIFQNEHAMKFIGDIPSDNDIIKFQEFFDAQWNSNGYGPCMIKLHDGRPIGVNGFKKLLIEGIYKIDFGFIFLPEFHRQGYLKETSEKLFEVARNQFNIQMLTAVCTPENLVARKSLESLGFKFVKDLQVQNEFIKNPTQSYWEKNLKY